MAGLAQKTDVGQACPDPVLGGMVNYPEASIRLSQFRPKIVILDFWNTRCLACISAFPHLDSLQKKFEGRVQILLVNSESTKETLEFFAKHKKLHLPRLPMITGDSQLIKSFTRDGYPYSVWIDGKGMVRYITAGYNTTEAHINSLLGTDTLKLSRAVKATEGSWLTDQPWKNEVVFFSALARRGSGKKEVSNLGWMSEDGQSFHFGKTGTLSLLFRIAYSNNHPDRFGQANSFLLRVKDPAPFVYPLNKDLVDEWEKTNWYNYELIVPAGRKADVYSIMQEDLCRYFGVKARVEQRTVNGLALVRAGNTGLLKTKGGASSGNLFPYYGEIPAEGSMRTLTNRPFSELKIVLQNCVERQARMPFADKTAYTGNIDITIPWSAIDSFNLGQWRQALKKYGLDLIEKPQPIDVLVISDK